MNDMDKGRRNARILALCQALYVCAISVDLTLTSITGYQLAPDKFLATLPFALITVGAAVVTVFAAFIIERLGRRIGFALGALCGAAGGLVSVWSIVHGNFWLFCLGTAGVGAFQGFAQFFAIAAADSVPKDYKSRAISTVLAGGVIAAIVGPVLASKAKDIAFDTVFAGSYLLVAALAVMSALIFLLFYRDVDMVDAQSKGEDRAARPLRAIAGQPIFVAGVATTMAASATMLIVMTASPLAAVACGFSIDDGASIIQWHLFGMFAPSLFAGRLVARFGVMRMLCVGTVLMACCVAIATSSETLLAFHLALLALGVGWNIMIVCGTTLLAQSYRANERGKAQALSGLLGNIAATFATLTSGAVLEGFGWSILNLLVLPPLAVCLLLVLRWRGTSRATFGEGIA
ncbi:MFS transporter [Rhizobium sp. Root1203]|uniref:MFS transporter n=1 Tax=Rhizobium sp. Root1203 TaxID=1736427 RepID=UPI00070F85C3|nr:MFS transporter [Rhizobium sp. Root1203]KQV10487.1 MFS transporter [Rhizobium sp. Root1203]